MNDEDLKAKIHQLAEMSSLHYYRLAEDGKTPMPVKDVLEWAKFFENGKERILRQDHFGFRGGIMVSTVFLGMDHGFGRFHPDKLYRPVLWETMIFGGEHHDWQNRACSHDEALANHAEAVALVAQSRKPWRLLRYWFSLDHLHYLMSQYRAFRFRKLHILRRKGITSHIPAESKKPSCELVK